MAVATGLPEAFDDAASGRRRRRSAHAPGQVSTDVAVLLADGGETITDLAVLRDQPGLGTVASTATAWRVLNSVDDGILGELKRARAVARERAWLLRGEAGRPVPTVRCGGVVVPGLVIDFDGSLVSCHSEKQGAARISSTIRISPVAGVAGQHQRGAGRDAATGQRRKQHRRQSHPAHQRGGSAKSPTPTCTVSRSWSAATTPEPPRNG
jgi:hypothetical protein